MRLRLQQQPSRQLHDALPQRLLVRISLLHLLYACKPQRAWFKVSSIIHSGNQPRKSASLHKPEDAEDHAAQQDCEPASI